MVLEETHHITLWEFSWCQREETQKETKQQENYYRMQMCMENA